MSDTGSEWNPQPAELRDGEVRTESTHAQRNLEQLKKSEQFPQRFAEKRREYIRQDGAIFRIWRYRGEWYDEFGHVIEREQMQQADEAAEFVVTKPVEGDQ